MPRPSSRRGDDALPDEPEGLVSSSKHRKCSSLREWLLEGLSNHEPSLYRSRSLPPGYSFRFVRSLGRILLCHDNGVVVSDTPEVLEPLDPLEPNSWGRHLSFLYGPLDIFLDLVERTTGQLLEVEPSSTVGMAGCIPVLVPSSPRAADLGDFGDLARALDPSTAAPAPDGHGPLPRHRSEVPARAPTRPKGSGLEVCLEQANSTAFAHLLQRGDANVKAVLSDGATPLIYALDRLRKTPWDCSKSLMSLNSCIVRLIENQADLNALVPPDQESPLQLLLRASHTEGELVNLCKSRLAVLMIRSRAEVNHLDRAGASPLSEAAMAGDVEMCRLLLDHGATVSNLGTANFERGWKADLNELSLDRKVQVLLKDAAMRQKQKLNDLVSLGRSHLSSKSSSRAQLCFLQALKLDPLNPELLLASAEATFVSGDFDKAYRDSSKVVALCPLNGLAYELCARSLWHLDRMGEALCVCRSMVPSNVSEKSVLLKLEGRMVKHCSCLDAVEAMLQEASNQEDLKLCEKTFQDLDCLLCDMDEIERASAWGKRICLAFVKVCLFPLPGLSWPLQSWAQRALSETRRLQRSERSAEILQWHARALLHCGCRQDALNVLRCAASPTTALLQSLEAAEQLRHAAREAAAAGGARQAALQGYGEAERQSRADPHFLASLWTEKAAVLLRDGEPADAALAAEELTRALAVTSEATAHYWRGVANLVLENYQQAASDLDAAIHLDPHVHPQVEEQRARAQRWLLCPPVPDHYEALGVKKNVNQVQLKKAYRLAALRWHPDKNVGQESMAEQAFKQIQQAFEVLSDERLRKDYDDYPGDRKPWKFGKRNGPGVSGG